MSAIEIEVPVKGGNIAKNDLVNLVFAGSKYKFRQAVAFALSPDGAEQDEISKLKWYYFKRKHSISVSSAEALVRAAGLAVVIKPVKRRYS